MSEQKITRTFVTTKVSVLCLNTETAEPCNVELILPTIYKDEKKLMKAVQAQMDSEGVDTNIKPVAISYKEEVETLYGMTLSKFLENAEVLPPRSVKKVQEETEVKVDVEAEVEA